MEAEWHWLGDGLLRLFSDTESVIARQCPWNKSRVMVFYEYRPEVEAWLEIDGPSPEVDTDCVLGAAVWHGAGRFSLDCGLGPHQGVEFSTAPELWVADDCGGDELHAWCVEVLETVEATITRGMPALVDYLSTVRGSSS